MKKNKKELNTVLRQFTYSVGGVYMTYSDFGPDGVIAADDVICVIDPPDEDGITNIFFKGDDDIKALLSYALQDVEETVLY